MASEAMLLEIDAEPEDAMTSISRQIRFLTTGDRAALRRIYLTRSPAAKGVVVKLLLGARMLVPGNETAFDRWQLIAHVAATLSGTGAVTAHSFRHPVGVALQSAGYSENRLLRLTAARGPSLHDQIGLAGRLLARARQTPVNLWTLFDLAGSDPIKVESARIRIAQDYYAAQPRSEGDSK